MFTVKLESSNCRKLLFTFCKARSIETHAECFFAEFSNSTQAYMTCRVLCFALSIKGKTLAMFLCCCLCCVYKSLVRSRSVCLHTHLGLSRSRLMSRVWWSLQLLHKELKEKHKWEYLKLLWIQERSSLWTRSCHVVMVVSFLLEIVIGCEWFKSLL